MHSSLPAPRPSPPSPTPPTAVCSHTHARAQCTASLSVSLSGNVCLIAHLRNTNFRLIALSRLARARVPSILRLIHGAFPLPRVGGQGDFAFVREFTVLEFECTFESKSVMCSLWKTDGKFRGKI